MDSLTPPDDDVKLTLDDIIAAQDGDERAIEKVTEALAADLSSPRPPSPEDEWIERAMKYLPELPQLLPSDDRIIAEAARRAADRQMNGRTRKINIARKPPAPRTRRASRARRARRTGTSRLAASDGSSSDPDPDATHPVADGEPL